MHRRLVDGDELVEVVHGLAGQPVVNASWLLGSMVMLDVGAIRRGPQDEAAGEHVFTVESGTWHLTGPGRSPVHSESPADLIREQVERGLQGERVSRAHYDADTTVLRLEFGAGAELVVSAHEEIDTEGEAWSLTTPDGRCYSLFPGGRIELETSDAG